MRHPVGVEPEEIHILRNYNSPRIVGVGEVLTIFGSQEVSIRRGCDVNAPLPEGNCQCRWDVFVQVKGDRH